MRTGWKPVPRTCIFTRLLAQPPLWRAARVARERRGRPARVRGPAVGSPKELARGNWHASTHGCAVTGARTVGDVGGCLVMRGARKWRLECVERGEIVLENVGIRVVRWERKTVFVRAREVDRRSKSEDTGTEDRASGTPRKGICQCHPPRAGGRSKRRHQSAQSRRLVAPGSGTTHATRRLLWSEGVRLPLRGVWEQMLHSPGSRTHPGLGSCAPLGRMGRACFR